MPHRRNSEQRSDKSDLFLSRHSERNEESLFDVRTAGIYRRAQSNRVEPSLAYYRTTPVRGDEAEA